MELAVLGGPLLSILHVLNFRVADAGHEALLYTPLRTLIKTNILNILLGFI